MADPPPQRIKRSNFETPTPQKSVLLPPPPPPLIQRLAESLRNFRPDLEMLNPPPLKNSCVRYCVRHYTKSNHYNLIIRLMLVFHDWLQAN